MRCIPAPNLHPLKYAHLAFYHLAPQVVHVKYLLALSTWSTQDYRAFLHYDYFFFMYPAPAVAWIRTNKNWVTTRTSIFTENLNVPVLSTDVAGTATIWKEGYVVCDFCPFFGVMVSSVAPRPQLNYEEQEDTNGLALRRFTCILLVCTTCLTRWPLIWGSTMNQ